MLMAELDGLEVKPTVISAGPMPGKKKKAGPRVADKSEDREDGFGKVSCQKPAPHKRVTARFARNPNKGS